MKCFYLVVRKWTVLYKARSSYIFLAFYEFINAGVIITNHILLEQSRFIFLSYPKVYFLSRQMILE